MYGIIGTWELMGGGYVIYIYTCTCNITVAGGGVPMCHSVLLILCILCCQETKTRGLRPFEKKDTPVVFRMLNEVRATLSQYVPHAHSSAASLMFFYSISRDLMLCQSFKRRMRLNTG